MAAKFHLLTGATSGLGLATAHRMLSDPGAHLVVGARRPEAARELAALSGRDRLRILPLDLASLASVRDFVAAVVASLDGATLASLGCNAGVQIVGPRRVTGDGFEETFQANLLGHALLIDGLQAHLAPDAPVVMTASGTHDPANKAARLFGFRGGIYQGIGNVAIGELDAGVSTKQQGLDRYATSKLCLILYVYARARRRAPGGPRFIAFDPGLMPGTGLARERSTLERWGWATLLPKVAALLPGSSTVKQSGLALTELLASRAHPVANGAHIDYGLASTPSSVESGRVDWQDEVDAFLRRNVCREAMT